MKCHVCGGFMKPIVTALPFKVRESAIVVLKGLPILACDNCCEFLIEDSVMDRVEVLLNQADPTAEVEIVQYAA